MDTPRILAIADVHLAAPGGDVEQLVTFYGDLIGLERIEADREAGPLVFRGNPRSGPRLIVGLDDRSLESALRRQVLIQVRCLNDCAEQLLDRRVPLVWAQGWTFFDRRLTTLDPGGNRVELVALHAM